AHHVVAIEVEPVWIEADGVRLEQIVMNLLSNSLKFTPRGGSITVSVRLEAGEAVLRVADSGSGISPQLLPSVFDLFVQGDRKLDRPTGGRGGRPSPLPPPVRPHAPPPPRPPPGPGPR